MVVKQCRAKEELHEYGVKKKKKKFQPTVLENGVRAGRKLEGMGKG